MLPPWSQRVPILLAALIGGAAWLAVGPALAPPDGSSGITLATARVGPIAAFGLVLLAGAPAIALGLVASVTAQMLSGVFAVGLGLAALAWWGGPIDGWLLRAPAPAAYGRLLGELGVWQAGVLLLLAAIQKGRAPLRTRLPLLAMPERLGLAADARCPEARAIAAGGLTALLGAGLCLLLIQSSDVAQVMISLFLAFAGAALAAHLAVPQPNPTIHLCAPAVVGALAYGAVLVRFGSREALLKAWFADGLSGPALALPIHYVSAGVAGCAFGLGWAEALRKSPSGDEA